MPKLNKKLTAVISAIQATGVEFEKIVATISGEMDEPLKAKWSESSKAMTKCLAGLPDPTTIDAEDPTEAWGSIAEAAQSVIDTQQLTITQLSNQMASAKAAVPGEITSAIDAKVTAGDFVPKAAHEQAIKDATASASTSARTAALADLKVIGDRKQLLATASIPVPADEALMGEDKDFTPKKDAAVKRAEELKVFKLAPERVLALCWNTDEAAYAGSLDLMRKAYEAAGKPGSPNPFLKRSGGDQPARSIGLC